MVKIKGCFGGIYRLHFHGQRIREARNSMKKTGNMLISFFAYSSTLKMEAICSSEMFFDSYRTDGVISQKESFFIVTATRTQIKIFYM
jgi:hypothetical protein